MTNTPDSHLTFCVVIPTKNRINDLLSAVKSVVAQTHLPDELIIIDQSVTCEADGMIRTLLADFRGIHYRYIFDNKLSGLTAAKNAGVNASASDIICFIDDDIVLENNFIQVILDAYKQRPDLSGVGGIALLPPGKRSPLRRLIAPLFQIGPFFDIRVLIQYNYRVKGDIVPSRFLSGGLCALRKEIFQHTQFNESLTGASPVEDLDFYSRAARQFKFAIACKAIADHKMSSVSRGGLRRSFELKCAGFAHIFREYIPKTPLNIFSFLWRNVGFIFDAAQASLQHRTLDPFQGVAKGWVESFHRREK